PSAGTTTWPSSARISESSSRMPISSSTTRMLAMAIASRRRQGSAGRSSHAPEHDRHGRAGASESIDQVDPGIVFVDYFLHHRESEARSTRLRGHVGLESAPKYIRRKSRPIVLDRKTHRLRRRVVSGRELVDGHRLGAYHDPPAVAANPTGGLHRCDRL